ncbi:putative MFS family arabinose efflux permease [Winogradskyella wandonensis]|uniref:Putative MFS family arabinose efflux permease n=1 Tax=Winogradskyella wandonensis TaxID=1442586 RepID=A0A4R1KQN3_9FLAO|nr:MFS transporter [Winogradskyella wandonensis]TCK66783.1 putative MFS family arabinose efflux permease [Winogradskyella wandonensis]
MKTPKYILPVIIFSQFCCTSLWFAGNAIIDDLSLNFNLYASALGELTSAVQFGFILGTFLFAILTITDRFSASKVFFFSAVIAGFINLSCLLPNNSLASLLLIRFATGFFLAGIYPVGMKIASDFFKAGLGKSLSYLVGALVLGTAFPHLLNTNLLQLNWTTVVFSTSTLSIIGGTLILAFVSNGPYYKKALYFDARKLFKVFRNRAFKSAAFGYFGHMWELYTFWAFTPILLSVYQDTHLSVSFNIPLFSFLIIAIGSLGCIIGGHMASKYSTKSVAKMALVVSGCCCLFSPIFLSIDSQTIFIIFLMIWGMAVIADSPLFSTLVAQNVAADAKGTALTIVNCIGFAITIVSLLIFNSLLEHFNTKYLFTILALGPLFGLYHLRKSA